MLQVVTMNEMINREIFSCPELYKPKPKTKPWVIHCSVAG